MEYKAYSPEPLCTHNLTPPTLLHRRINQTKRTNPLMEQKSKEPKAMQSQRPVTPEPIIPTKPTTSHAKSHTPPTTTNFTSHQETNKAAQAAIHNRIHNLPNTETVKGKIGKKNKGLRIKNGPTVFSTSNFPLFMAAASCENSPVSVIYHLLRMRNVHDVLSGNNGISEKRKLGGDSN